jgi:hypothetical protein
MPTFCKPFFQVVIMSASTCTPMPRAFQGIDFHRTTAVEYDETFKVAKC